MASTGEAVLVVDRTPELIFERTRGPFASAAWASVLVTLSVVLYLGRGIERLASPRVFAEDGQIFLQGAHNDGIAALWAPYAGYLHVIPRLVAGVLDFLPLTWLPALYAWVAVAGYLFAITPVLSRRLAWLLPSSLARAVAFALLCLLPTGVEVYGNISNLIFVGGLTLTLLAFSADPHRSRDRVAELVVVALLGLSGPVGAVIAPAFVWRWWRNRRSVHSARVAAVLGATAAVQAVLTFTTGRETPGGGSAALIVQAVAERVGGAWLFGGRQLFTGRQVPLADLSVLVWVLGALLIALVALRLTGAVGWVLLTLLVGAGLWAYGFLFIASPTAEQRHLLSPLAIAVVLLVAAACRPNLVVRVAAVVWLLAGVAGVVDNFVAPGYDMPADMAALAACEQPACTIPIYDGDWHITLRR